MSSLKNRLQAQYASVSSQTPKLQFLGLLHLLRVKSVRKVAYPVRYKRVATVLYLHTTTSCYCCCCCNAYLSSCYRTVSDANLLDDPHTFHCLDYFVYRRNPHLLRSFRRSNVPVDFFEFLSTEFAACPKPSSRDNHCKASHPRTQ